MNTVVAPVCPYCDQPAVLVPDSVVYNGTSYGGHVWHCAPCEAWVGTHRNSPLFKPLGRLANKELRFAKIAAHAAFDPLWQRKVKAGKVGKKWARNAGYNWLAQKMGMAKKDCHIGYMDLIQCRLVVEICSKYSAKGEVRSQNEHHDQGA